MDRISVIVREERIAYSLLLPDCEGNLFPSPSYSPTRMAELRCKTIVYYQDVLMQSLFKRFNFYLHIVDNGIYVKILQFCLSFRSICQCSFCYHL